MHADRHTSRGVYTMFWTLVQERFSKSAKIGFFHKKAPTNPDKKTMPKILSL